MWSATCTASFNSMRHVMHMVTYVHILGLTVFSMQCWKLGRPGDEATICQPRLLLLHFLLTHTDLKRMFSAFLSSWAVIAILIGQRQRLRTLTRELSPECLDTAGHTPLMYAVFGNQAKVLASIFHKFITLDYSLGRPVFIYCEWELMLTQPIMMV